MPSTNINGLPFSSLGAGVLKFNPVPVNLEVGPSCTCVLSIGLIGVASVAGLPLFTTLPAASFVVPAGYGLLSIITVPSGYTLPSFTTAFSG